MPRRCARHGTLVPPGTNAGGADAQIPPPARLFASDARRRHQRRLSRAAGARAIYWEFDPDNDWKSAFFPCRSYAPERAWNDDWAADYEQSAIVEGPSMPEMARLAAASWDKSAADVARNAYLVRGR